MSEDGTNFNEPPIQEAASLPKPVGPSRTFSETSHSPKLTALRYAGRCSVCNAGLPAKTRAYWQRDARAITCVACWAESMSAAAPPDSADGPPLVELDRGTAGRSARTEYERRHQKREQRLDAKFGPFAGVVKFLSDDPQTTKAWANGATGEVRVATQLEERLGARGVVLNDRRVPGTRGNIDHLAIAASGVWVIDAKHYAGKVERRDKGGWFRTDWRLYVGGRDKTTLAAGLNWQVAAVERALANPDVPLHPALCFVGADWGLFSKPFQHDGVWVTWISRLAEMILEPGMMSDESVRTVAAALAHALPDK